MNLKTIILYIFLSFIFVNAHSQDTTLVVKDSLAAQEEMVQDEIIDEIVETRNVPKKDKIQYFSKLTRFGFKNLFPTYSYNAAAPYSSQVNPNAERYMQDYLRGHETMVHALF